MQTATAQDIGPDWPCWAAVSRMWVNDPAPAIAASTTAGAVSASAAAIRRGFTGVPPFRPVSGMGRVGTWRGVGQRLLAGDSRGLGGFAIAEVVGGPVVEGDRP